MYVGEAVVNVKSSSFYNTSIDLVKGNTYRIVASGTMLIRPATANNGWQEYHADAEFTRLEDADNGGVPKNRTQDTQSVNVGIGLNNNEPNWGAYNPDHIYTRFITHTTASQKLKLKFFDSAYADNLNDGNLKIDVYEQSPEVSIEATDGYASETSGDVPVDPGTFKVERTGSVSASMDVYYSVSGSATEDDGSGTGDYQRLPGTSESGSFVHRVTIQPGQSSVTFEVVPIKNDESLEDVEDIVVTLMDPPNEAGGPPSYVLADPTTNPTTGTTTQPTTAPVKLDNGEVGAIAGQAGIIGGVVPSKDPKFAVRHFVSPKAADQVVTLEAGVQAGKTFAELYKWDGGDPVAGNAAQRTVSRTAPGRYDVKLVSVATNQPVYIFTVWVVWADMTLVQTAPVRLGLGIATPPPDAAGNARPDIGVAVETEWAFNAEIFPKTIITDPDRPSFDGPPISDAPNRNALHVLDLKKFGQPAGKWDISRQFRKKFLSPAIGPDGLQEIPGPMYAQLPNANQVVGASPNQGPDGFPVDEAEGNDDSGNEGVREFTDPESQTHKGLLIDNDLTSGPGILERAGAVGATFEARSHYREFARLEIAGKWYKISNFGQWRFHVKLRKIWEALGPDGKPGKSDVDDDNKNGVDDLGETGLYDDDDKNGNGIQDARDGGFEGHWVDDGSLADKTNDGW